jgi:hypothetical protein
MPFKPFEKLLLFLCLAPVIVAHGSPRKLVDSSPREQHAERASNRPCGAEFNRMPDSLTTKSGPRVCGYVASVAFVV